MNQTELVNFEGGSAPLTLAEGAIVRPQKVPHRIKV